MFTANSYKPKKILPFMETQLDLWPNATVPICRTVHKFGGEHPEILGISCFRYCSVGMNYALPGSDVDGLTLLVDTQIDGAQIMNDLETTLASVGSPFIVSDAMILNYEDALRQLDSLTPEYEEDFQENPYTGKTFNGVEYEEIEKERKPIRDKIKRIPPLALRICIFYRDCCLYARDVIPHRPIPEFLRGFLIAGERNVLEMKHPKTKKREIRLSLFSQWNSLSDMEKQVVKSLHQHGNRISSTKPELLAVLDSFVNKGLMRKLPLHLTWNGGTQVYAQLWSNGDRILSWEKDSEESVRIWKTMTGDYDFELANKLNGSQ